MVLPANLLLIYGFKDCEEETFPSHCLHNNDTCHLSYSMFVADM